MQANEFDEQIRQKFEHAEFAYKPQQWDALARQLSIVQEEKKQRGFIWWMKLSGMAAAVILCASAGIKWFAGNDKQPPAIAQQAAQTKPTEQTAPVLEYNKTEEAPQQLLAANTTVKASNNKPFILSRKATLTKQKNNTSSATPANTDVAQMNTTPIIAEPANNGFTAATTDADVKQEEIQLAAAEKKKKYNQNIPDYIMLAEPAKINTGKTAISFTGGVNYGSLNAGYMVGINAQKSVSKKVFIEGNMGIVNNNVQYVAANKSAISATPGTNGFNAADADPNNIKTAEIQAAYVAPNPANLYYLQVTPSVGYNIYKGLSVSFGADFQQLLQNSADNDENDGLASMAVNDRSERKYIPSFDIGVTGKTEYMLTKRLKAGIAYRNGVNSLLKNNKLYLDRNYLQVQLKYTIIY